VTDWTTRPRPLEPSRWAFAPGWQSSADDIIAIGGDLEPSTVIGAYRQGVFPMIVETPEPLLAWWSPDPRGIIPLDKLRVSTSLRRSAKRFDVRVDTCFAEVIRACANPARERGWITPEFIDAYVTLHELGWAHSVEIFDRAGQLAGGLYGVRINGFFAGESMFYTQRDASKVALMFLVRTMRETGMTLLDVQWCTEHLASLGAVEVERTRYLKLLAGALEQPV
jgi:leucyl/phenylalanyl-tRNA--protein transferase